MSDWDDLKAQLLAELSAAQLAIKDASKGDERVTYRSIAELRDMIDLIDSIESQADGASFTTVAKRVRI